MKSLRSTLILFISILGATAFLHSSFTTVLDPSAYQIIKEAQDRMTGKTSIAEMTITIQRPKWKREMSLKTWTKGDDKSISLVTAPARDKGTVFLRVGKEVWNWVPTVERVIKLPPSMMSQSWMGTDLTNDDLVNQTDLKEDFTHTLLGKKTVGDRMCYQVQSVPKESAAVVWGKIVTWIDVTDYIQMKTEFYDEDDFLINTFNAHNIKVMGGKKVASKFEIVPEEKPGNKTIMEYKSLKFDELIADDIFTTRNMRTLR